MILSIMTPRSRPVRRSAGTLIRPAPAATTVAPTCTETGSYDEVIYCSVCDAELSRTPKTIDALGHDLVHHDAQEATCLAIGWDAYDTCLRCDYTTYEEIPALGHDLVHHDTKDPTCTEIGWNAYDTCSRCDYTTYEEIPALGHDLVHHDAKAATCTEIGWNAYDTCTRCDYTTYEAIPANGHTPADPVNENVKDSTCTEGGTYDEVIYCSVCHEELSRTEKTIDAKGHKPAEAIEENRVDATCTETGSYDEVVYCSVCGEELSRTGKTIEKIPHTPGEAVRENEVAASCTEEGSYDEVVYCSVCHAEISRTKKTIDAKGHTPAEAVAENHVEPKCMDKGSYDEVVYCSVCNAEISRVTKDIPALGHDWDNGTPDPDSGCTAEGSMLFTCKREGCGETRREAISAKGHQAAAAVEENRVEPKCLEKGSYESVVYCSVCGSELSRETKEIPALGHDLISHDAQAPTCTEIGWKAYDTCSRCDYSTYEEISALGHTPAEAVEENRVAPTCTENGSYDEVVYCSVCNAELSRTTHTIDAIGHDLVFVKGTATCMKAGTIGHYECSNCGKFFKDKDAKIELTADEINVDRVDHNFGNPRNNNDRVTHTLVCIYGCGTYGPREEHSFTQKVETRQYQRGEATCTEPATYFYSCACGEKGYDSFSPEGAVALGHAWKVVAEEAPTCTKDGHEAYEVCTRCGDINSESGTFTVLPATGHGTYAKDNKKSGQTADGSLKWTAYSCPNGCGDYYMKLSVTAKDSAGNPVSGVNVQITDKNGKVNLSGKTNANGVFNPSESVKPGIYTFTLTNGSDKTTATITLSNGQASGSIGTIGQSSSGSGSGSSSGSGSGSSSGSSGGYRCPMCDFNDSVKNKPVISWFVIPFHAIFHFFARLFNM